MTFTAVPAPLIPDARYSVRITWSMYASGGVVATTTADAADFTIDGNLSFGGSATVNNLTGSGIISGSAASNTLVQVGSAGNFTGLVQNGGDIGDGSPPAYPVSLTVGDGIQTANLTVTPFEPLNPYRYSGTTLVKVNATLVGGSANALAPRSDHVIDGTLQLAGGSSTVKSLSGSGTVDLGANILTVTGGGTFGGTILGTD